MASALCACSSVASAKVDGKQDNAGSAPAKLEGVLFEREADAYPSGAALKSGRPSYFIATPGGATSLTEAQPEDFVGQLVTVSDTDALEDGVQGHTRLVHAEQHLQAAPPPGPQTVLVILITTPDDPTPATADPEAARSEIFTAPNSTGAFYAQQSDGATTLIGRVDPSGDVIGPIALNTPMRGCPDESIANEADVEASALGYSPAAYDHVIYMLPNSSECPWGGLGDLPGRRSWSNGYLQTSVLAHELGHNMGAHHANSLACVDASGNVVPYSDTCTSTEYGDPFDAMGTSGTLMGAFHRMQIGELPLERIERLRESASVELGSSEDFISSGPRLLLVPIKHPHLALTEYFAIDSRSPLTPFDWWSAGAAVSTGLTVRKVEESSYAQTQLLNMHPGEPVADSPLQPGETFSDPADDIAITADTSPSGQLQAAVTMPALPLTDDVPPTPPPWLYVSSTSTVAHLSWQAGDDDVAVGHYRILRDGVDLGTTTGLSFDDPTVLAESQTTYSVITVDTSGNESVPISETIAIPPLSYVTPKSGTITVSTAGYKSAPVTVTVASRPLSYVTPQGGTKGAKEAAGRIVVRQQLRRGRHGHVLVSLHCASVDACKGRAKLTVSTHSRNAKIIGEAGYSIRAGGSKDLSVRVTDSFATAARRRRSTIRVTATLAGESAVSRICFLPATKQ